MDRPPGSCCDSLLREYASQMRQFVESQAFHTQIPSPGRSTEAELATELQLENAATVSVHHASWSAHASGEAILQGIHFDIDPGDVLGVVGPNGAGKSTLLRLLYRFHAPRTGAVAIDNIDIWSLPAREVALKVAAVLQEQPTDFALTVSEIVALGRIPHRKNCMSVGDTHDEQIVQATLTQLNLLDFAERPLGTLSGGERQRVMVARALAQQPRVLILDEPTNHLDIRYQLEILELIRELPLTIITSLHDLNMASAVCDRVLLLKDGRQVGFGKPEEVLREDSISESFHVNARRDLLSLSKTKRFTFNLCHIEI